MTTIPIVRCPTCGAAAFVSTGYEDHYRSVDAERLAACEKELRNLYAAVDELDDGWTDLIVRAMERADHFLAGSTAE